MTHALTRFLNGFGKKINEYKKGSAPVGALFDAKSLKTNGKRKKL